MADKIKKVAVIGSGVMGCGIAAQIANAGVPVLLLDIVPKEGGNRNAIAEAAVARAQKTEPAPFMSAGAAKLIECGNIEDHLARVAECDWIVEVVVERLDIKQALYRKLEEVRRPGTAISSNTSTIPLGKLIEGLPETFARDFMITHFFNPPRYMRLLELVTGPATDQALAEKISAFCDVALGKSIVGCKDSPGFIANRLGVFWMTGACRHGCDRTRADGGGSRRHHGPPLRHPKNRRVRIDGSGRPRPHAACQCQPFWRAAPNGCVSRKKPPGSAGRKTDRDRLYRPQRQRRFLSAEQSRRQAREGSDRFCQRAIPRRA
jgi:hypothetical protein